LRDAETLLGVEQVPIVPLFFYAGFNYYDSDKIGGIYQNVLDEHPLQEIFSVDLTHEVGLRKAKGPQIHGAGGGRRQFGSRAH
jgi:hypothetical protein